MIIAGNEAHVDSRLVEFHVLLFNEECSVGTCISALPIKPKLVYILMHSSYYEPNRPYLANMCASACVTTRSLGKHLKVSLYLSLHGRRTKSLLEDRPAHC